MGHEKNTKHLQEMDCYITSGSHGAGVSERSTLQQSKEQNPPVISIKKDPPTYPAGKETWTHLNIIIKERTHFITYSKN